MEHSTKPAPGRVRRTVVMAALLGLAVIGLSQCRGVAESITGVSLATESTAQGRGVCVKQCTRDYREDMRTETARFKEELRACGSDRDCVEDARSEFRDNLATIRAAHQACKRACYNEGGGTGGR